LALACLFAEGFEGGPSALVGKRQKRSPRLAKQAVEKNQPGGRFTGQALDAARGRMQPHLEGVKGERFVQWEY
jgi:hypothetical protein